MLNYETKRKYMLNSEELIEKLFAYYRVSNVSELSRVIDSSQAVISNWKIRNSINAIKKKCRELGIYNEIFGDSSSVSIVQGNGGRAAAGVYNEGAKTSESQQSQLNELTMPLIKKLIDKIGEDELQLKLMELIKNG
jgi:hypothetical protein